MSKNNNLPYQNEWSNGVNPVAHAKWVEEDRNERIQALHDLCSALWKVESLYEVASESDHPLEQAYDLIYKFIESEGLQDEF